jgi:hypothetical protein
MHCDHLIARPSDQPKHPCSSGCVRSEAKDAARPVQPMAKPGRALDFARTSPFSSMVALPFGSLSLTTPICGNCGMAFATRSVGPMSPIA